MALNDSKMFSQSSHARSRKSSIKAEHRKVSRSSSISDDSPVPYTSKASGRGLKNEGDHEVRPRQRDSISFLDASTRTSNSKDTTTPSVATRRVPNVFQFLEKDESPDDSSSETGKNDGSVISEEALASDAAKSATMTAATNYPARVCTSFQEPQRRPISPAAVSTVSSIESMKSGHSVPFRETCANPIQPHAMEDPVHLQSLAMAISYNPGVSHTEDTISTSNHVFNHFGPEAYYVSQRDRPVPPRPPLPPSPPKSPDRFVRRNHRRLRKNSLKQPLAKQPLASSGYALLASQLSSSFLDKEHMLPPLFRRFEHLNHRVLLYLQDEIAQMEEELRLLDEYEEVHRIAAARKEGTELMPASRRMEVQAQVYSPLHHRRLDLMSALTQKTEQYNKALSAYSRVLQTLPHASERDVKKYRTWMKAKSPIAAPEALFLDHTDDLVCLTPRNSVVSTATAPISSTIIIASSAILLPLLAFNMISEFSGRLVVITVVGGAAAAIATNPSNGTDQIVETRDGWRCSLLYFGFMITLAVLIP